MPYLGLVASSLIVNVAISKRNTNPSTFGCKNVAQKALLPIPPTPLAVVIVAFVVALTESLVKGFEKKVIPNEPRTTIIPIINIQVIAPVSFSPSVCKTPCSDAPKNIEAIITSMINTKNKTNHGAIIAITAVTVFESKTKTANDNAIIA